MRLRVIPFPSLTDKLVALRPWAPPDIGCLLAAGNDPVVRRFRYSLPVDADGASEWLARKEAQRLRGSAIELAIADAAGAAARGSISLWDLDPGYDHAMISYWVGPGARGRGLAPAAVRLMSGWAFEELRLARLALLIEPDNLASRRVAERCGFVHDGTLRGHFAGRGGSRVDALVYGLLAAAAAKRGREAQL